MGNNKIPGMIYCGCEKSVVRAIRKPLGDNAVEADVGQGGVGIDASADPQIKVLAMDGAGHSVEEVRA